MIWKKKLLHQEAQELFYVKRGCRGDDEGGQVSKDVSWAG